MSTTPRSGMSPASDLIGDVSELISSDSESDLAPLPASQPRRHRSHHVPHLATLAVGPPRSAELQHPRWVVSDGHSGSGDGPGGGADRSAPQPSPAHGALAHVSTGTRGDAGSTSGGDSPFESPRVPPSPLFPPQLTAGTTFAAPSRAMSTEAIHHRAPPSRSSNGGGGSVVDAPRPSPSPPRPRRGKARIKVVRVMKPRLVMPSVDLPGLEAAPGDSTIHGLVSYAYQDDAALEAAIAASPGGGVVVCNAQNDAGHSPLHLAVSSAYFRGKVVTVIVVLVVGTLLTVC